MDRQLWTGAISGRCGPAMCGLYDYSQMSNVRIITDTIAQLPPDVAGRYGIEVVPAATATCGGKVLTDGVDLTIPEVYRALDRGARFTTAAISPAHFSRVLERLSETTSEIVCITVSEKLSSVFRSASAAAEGIIRSRPWLDLKVFDSRNATGGQGLIVLSAAMVAARGKTLCDVLLAAEKARRQAWCLFVMDTVRYAHRTGRIPKLFGDVAETAGVKPMFKIGKDGLVHLVSFSRDRGKGILRIMDSLEAEMGRNLIDVFVAHSAAAQDAKDIEARLQARFNCRYSYFSEFSPIMAFGAGPGVLGVAACPVEKEGGGTS